LNFLDQGNRALGTTRREKEGGKGTMTAPQASVVIPAYNAEKTLARTVESLFLQTAESLEIIIVDDGSIDRTPEICEALQKDSPFPMKVLRQKNGGDCSARNRGIASAEGEYVIFLDADDIAEREYVDKLVKAAQRDPACDIACCSFDLLYEDGSSRPRLLPCKGTGEILSGRSALSKLLEERLDVWSGSGAYRRCCLIEKGVYFDETLSMGGDTEFRWRAFYHARKVALVKDVLVHYVQHDASVTRSFDPRRFPPSSWLDPVNFLEYLKEQEEEESELLSLVRDEVIPRYTLRRLRNEILYGLRDLFWRDLNEDSTKEALRRGEKMFLQAPELASKCFMALHFPGAFCNRYKRQVKE
jgi:glycosyltransferase involved in cell wall biosynthesis